MICLCYVRHVFIDLWHAGHKSVHLVSGTKNSSNEKRHPFSESDRFCPKRFTLPIIQNIFGIFGTKYNVVGTYIHTCCTLVHTVHTGRPVHNVHTVHTVYTVHTVRSEHTVHTVQYRNVT